MYLFIYYVFIYLYVWSHYLSLYGNMFNMLLLFIIIIIIIFFSCFPQKKKLDKLRIIWR